MKPRIGPWLICSALGALAACLNPLPDDNPSRAESVVARPDTTPPANTPGFGSDGEMSGSPAQPNFPADGLAEAPSQESPTTNNPSGPADAGADGGALRTVEATMDGELAPDAGSSLDPP